MFVFGHLGIGGAIARNFVRLGEPRWALLGALLPDLIDKPVYYGLVLATGKRAAELGLISSTRTFGHTAIVALFVWLLLRRFHGAAIALGMATHLVLDLFGDFVSFAANGPPRDGPATHAAVFWPAFGKQFPIASFRSLAEHALSLANAYQIAAEILGLVLLAWLWRRGELSLSRPWASPPRAQREAEKPPRPGA